jgi:hypothetical protein
VTFKIGIVDVALRQNLRNRVSHGLTDPQLALRAAGSGVFGMVAGHGGPKKQLSWPGIAV